jgi:CII-binding regulator of phage lambda lysogenization HflD
MSNPWGVTLKKTGLNQKRLDSAQSQIDELNQRQDELQQLSTTNMDKQNMYEDRQGSLAADAMMGLQGRIPIKGGKFKKNSKRHRKSRKNRKTRKYRKHRRYQFKNHK